MSQSLLTIAIPTFNRATLLDRCLNSILSQITDDIKNDIELIVSDNNSDDNTFGIVNKYLEKDASILYSKNSENVGADRNIAACFLKATGKYVWVISDDDLIRPGYFKFIFDLLRGNNFGVVYMQSLWYTGQFDKATRIPTTIDCTRYNNPLRFVERVNYWTTFISGNIVNKPLLNDLNAISQFYDTSLVQLSWILPVVFSARENLVVNDQVLACQEENTGGYKFYRVFGKNFNTVMDTLISKMLIDKRVKNIINIHLLSSFFPMFMRRPLKTFETERPLKILIPIFWNYPMFWIKVFPVLLRNQYRNNANA